MPRKSSKKSSRKTVKRTTNRAPYRKRGTAHEYKYRLKDGKFSYAGRVGGRAVYHKKK